jgi:methionine-rich copper-binding protein CopC
MKLTHRLFLAVGLLAAFTTIAQAHAYPDHAEPRVGSTVVNSPAKVRIWFSMEVRGASSGIVVLDGQQKQIDEKDVEVDPNDKTLMSVSIPKLPPGSYKVVWHAVCPSGHHTSGSYIFTVANP